MKLRRRSHLTRLHLDVPKAVQAAAPAEAPEPRSTWRQRLGISSVMLVCLAGVAAISYFVLVNKSIRLDESQSLWQTSHSFSGMLRVVATDVHVPLYHIILHFWQLYLGNNVHVIRGLSLLFFMATIPVIYLLARQLLSIRWSLFAMTLFSFSPFMNWYANEARMYTLLALMTALNQLFFLRILRRRKGWLGFTITALIGAYSHYFFMFTLAAQGVYYLANREKFAKGTFKRLLLVGILVVLELAPWIWYFTSLGSANNTRPMLAAPSSVDFFNAFSQFLYGFQTDTVNTILISCWPLLMLIAFFAVNRQQRVTPQVGYIATIAFLPVALAFALSFLVTPFFVSRYLIAAVGPLITLSVWLVSYYKRTLAFGVAALMLVVVSLTSFEQDTSANTPVVENFKVAASTISSEARAQDVVVISSPFTIYPFEYYYNGVAQIKTLPIWDRKSSGSIPGFNQAQLPGQVNQLKDSHRFIYLLLSYDQGYQEKIRQYMDNNYERTKHDHFSDGMDLYVYRVGYDTVPPLGSAATTKPVTPVSSFWKFCIVGLINTVTDVTLFTVLHTAGVALLVANIISTSVALGISYVLNRRYTFPTDKISHSRIALYFAVTLGGLWVLAPITIKALMNLDSRLHYSHPFIMLLGHATVLQTVLPKIGSVAVTLIWNYVWYSQVVFAQPRPKQQPDY